MIGNITETQSPKPVALSIRGNYRKNTQEATEMSVFKKMVVMARSEHTMAREESSGGRLGLHGRNNRIK